MEALLDKEAEEADFSLVVKANALKKRTENFDAEWRKFVKIFRVLVQKSEAVWMSKRLLKYGTKNFTLDKIKCTLLFIYVTWNHWKLPVSLT